MDPTMEHEEAAAPPEAPKASLWEDLVDVFMSPAELYRRRANDGWVKPWVVLSIVSAVLYYVFLPATKAVSQAAMQEAMAKRGINEVPQNAQGIANTFQMIGGIIVPIGLLVGILLTALVIWVVAAIAKGGPTYRQAAVIAAWASFVGVVQQVVSSILIILKNNSGGAIVPAQDTSFGVMRFLAPDSVAAVLVPVLNRLDIFAIWQALLWLVALHVICRWPTAKAASVAAVSWIIMAVPMMVWAMIRPG